MKLLNGKVQLNFYPLYVHSVIYMEQQYRTAPLLYIERGQETKSI